LVLENAIMILEEWFRHMGMLWSIKSCGKIVKSYQREEMVASKYAAGSENSDC
jgi:hypothetical protein